MYEPLTDEERAVRDDLFWSQPMWIYHVLVFGGLGAAVVANVMLALDFGAATQPGLTPADVGLLIVALVGAAIALIGLVLRRLELRKLLYPPCPQCGQPNIQTSGFCRGCGIPLPSGNGAVSSPHTTPVTGAR
jgi:hypothetical protein